MTDLLQNLRYLDAINCKLENGLELCKRALCAVMPGVTESSVQMGSDEEPREDKSQCRLSELFVDDAWGTAKSLPSLKQHSDHKKWLQRSGLSVKAFKDLEKRLSVYEVAHLTGCEVTIDLRRGSRLNHLLSLRIVHLPQH